MKVKVVLERGEDGYYSACCPALRSCWSQGKTWEEALFNIREAVELFQEPEPEQLVTDEKREIVELT